MLTGAMINRDPFDPSLRGFHVQYRKNEVNRCPACGRTHWIIGRATAECAFCATALPLEQSRFGAAGEIRGRRS